MNRSSIIPAVQAILAAVLFGVSAPLSKMLLGNIEPVPLSSLLYLGSGIGLLLFRTVLRFVSKQKDEEAPLTKKDIPWLAGAVVFGGIAAPIILMVSLKTTPASTASLLLNFETVATTLIALLAFKESIGRRVAAAVGLVTMSSVLLSWDFSNQWGFSTGALGVIFACFCWGADNNFTRNISSKNPFAIVIIKGIVAGTFSLLLAIAIKSDMPDIAAVLGAMLLGFFSYGFSIVLFVYAMRNMGSARTSAFFGTAPFIGAVFSFLLFKSVPDIMFLLAFPIMIAGSFLLLKDRHEHMHRHEAVMHEHRHTHNDGHHNHVHEDEAVNQKSHSHVHVHETMDHSHRHLPDVNHRHSHRHEV